MKIGFSRNNIIKRGAVLFAALCLCVLTGCRETMEDTGSVLRDTVYLVRDKVNAVKSIIEPDREFSRIPTPEGKMIYTADMVDNDTVLMMAEGEYSDEFRIITYSIEDRRTETICSGTLLNNDNTEGYSMRTLCVNPFVTVDTNRNIVYVFSDDYLSVKTVDIDDLDTHSYEFSPSRNCLIYAVSTDYACELREFSFEDNESALLMDLSRDYGYIWLSGLFDSDGVAALECVKLFSGEQCCVFADLDRQSVIGEAETGYTYVDGAMELDVLSFDADSFNIGTIDAESGIVSALFRLSDAEGSTIRQFTIDTEESVYRSVEDGMLFDFENTESGKCSVAMYSTDGTLLKSGQFTVGDFTTLAMENLLHPQLAADVSDDAEYHLYLKTSDENAYAGDTLVFGLCVGDKIGSVMLWDTAMAVDDGDAVATGRNIGEMAFALSSVIDSGYSDSNTEYAEAIEDAFGVTIYYGDDADHDFVDYNTVPEYDESKIRRGLDALKDSLELFPEDFFRDMLGDGMRNINIYFCSELTPQGENSIETAAAFTYMLHGNAIVVMNTGENNSIFGSFCHEFMHVIDNRLSAAGYMDENVWSGFNPDGFEYFNSYKDANGGDLELAPDARFTSGDNDYTRTGDADYVWFVDAYATTYPTEDRARLFEYAMRYHDDLPEFYHSSHIQQKLSYMFDLIRQCWDSSDWPEITVWENALMN